MQYDRYNIIDDLLKIRDQIVDYVDSKESRYDMYDNYVKNMMDSVAIRTWLENDAEELAYIKNYAAEVRKGL